MARHLIEGDVLRVEKAGTAVGARPALNLVEGAGVSLTVTDNSDDGRIDVAVAATGGAGVASFNGRTGAVTLTEADVEGALSGVAFGSGEVLVGGVKVLGAQGGAIADATGTADAVTRFNTLLARLRAHGLIAS